MTGQPKRRKEDRMPGRLWMFFYRLFFMVGVAAFVSVVLLLVTLSRLLNYTPPALPDDIVLTYTFKSDLEEMVTRPSLLQPLLRPATTLHDIISGLDSAAVDDRVRGFAAKIEDVRFTPAQVQELRAAILRFRKAGKYAHVYSDSLGGFSSGMGDYYLASAFDRIWVQPVGIVALGGVAAEVPFLKEMLDKAGVYAQFAHRGIYKSAPESLTETGMTPPHREMMESIVGDLSGQMVADMAESRGMTVASMQKLVNEGPYSDKQALELKLIDRIGYYDEMMTSLMAPVAAPAEDEKAESETETESGGPIASGPDVVGLIGYSFVNETRAVNKGAVGFLTKLMRKEAPAFAQRDRAKIALIFGSGEIVPFRPRAQAAFGEGGMAADKIVEAFRAAQRDPDVAAIVFRIDTPGGAPSAAETIRRVILETQEKGKPVIVSMSSYAASGGYWIAAPAKKIVAQPGTLTGSIGVFGGKFVLAGLWDKLGLRWESVSSGDHANMWSANRPFTAEELARFDAMLGHIYESFLDRVMEGRSMSRAQVEQVAEGRVFTGRQAQAAGLVDELGGLERAVALARAAPALPPEQDVPLVRFPPRKSTLEMFISLATEGAFFRPDINISMQDVAAALQQAAQPQDGLLRMEEMDLR